MATLYTINVKNDSLQAQNFYFFQKPAVYTGGPQVYSNSIYKQKLLPYANSGSILTFQFLQQYYAGAQTRQHPPVVGQASGFTTSSQAIDLTSATGTGNNTTQMVVDPLGLSPAINTAGVQPGAFRIISPAFNPVLQQFNAGLAVKDAATGLVTLSNFVTVEPSKNLDCQPVLTFYVQTGDYQAGDVINFTTSSIGAAACDTTPGYTTFNITYNLDGSWTVLPSGGQAVKVPGLTQLIGRSDLLLPSNGSGNGHVASVPSNTNIKNEAGTSVICTGDAANYNPPFLVTNLSNPTALRVFGEYQVGPMTGPYSGRLCTAINGTTATFGN
ncbi:hypothetical protein LZC95_06710 [Pendulispora brunnea]|uniref:Uncharacterized protein n=1 Tax=Pendulispora brunnea TaxID=2905690 RepID=A0ABZ2KHI9_9BACT